MGMTIDGLNALDDLHLLAETTALAVAPVAEGVVVMRDTMGVDTGQLQSRTGITRVTDTAGMVEVEFVADTPYAGWHDALHTDYWGSGVRAIAAGTAQLAARLQTWAGSGSGGVADPRRHPWTRIDPATVTVTE